MTDSIDISILGLVNGSTSSFWDAFMLTLTSGYTWIPLYIALLYLVIYNSETMSQIMLVVGCALLCVVFSGGLSDYVVKPLVCRVRPINDPMLGDIIVSACKAVPKDFSFFSSHAANTISLAVFFSLLVRNMKLFVALLIWSLTNCYTRLYLGLHYPSDILVGLLWGAFIGVLVYSLYVRLYSKVFSPGEFISTQYTSKGYTISTVDIVLCVIVLIYIVSMIISFIMA